MHTMGGEFFFLPDLSLQLEGGHAVNIVGYSDTFQTEHGHTGGWIVKNSWWDGLPPNEQFWRAPRPAPRAPRRGPDLGSLSTVRSRRYRQLR